MSSGPSAVRTSALLTPPTTSLLTIATIVVEDDNRWENGFEIEGEGCGTAAAWDDCGSDLKVPGDSRANSQFTPFVIYSTDSCSTWGYSKGGERDRRAARVKRNLATSESFILEQELWGDTLGVGNPKIADTSALTYSTGLPILQAVAQIEDAAGDLARGAGVYIHMRPYQFTLLVHEQILRLVDGKWITPMGSVIVPGRGYAGDGPAGEPATTTEEWIYATAPVEVRLGAPYDIDDPKDVVARDTNDVLLIAERKAIASFDPTCLRIAMKVTR